MLFCQVYSYFTNMLCQNFRFDESKTNNAGMSQEIRELQTKISGLTSRNVELEAANSSIQKRLADLLKEMEDKESNFRNEMARKVGGKSSFFIWNSITIKLETYLVSMLQINITFNHRTRMFVTRKSKWKKC